MDWLNENFNPELWAKIAPLGREKMAEWVEHDGRFLHPNSKQQLELDDDLVALGLAFDQEEFFTKAISDLRAGGPQEERGQRLLRRYVAIGPAAGTWEQWGEWWKTNKPYLFASDTLVRVG